MARNSPFSSPPLLRSRALLALALGLVGLTARAEAPPTIAREAEHFTQACSALDAGELENAARHLRALRTEQPDLPEGQLLEALLTLRRERPSLGGLEAFIRAWNEVGRPDFSDSRLLPAEFPPRREEDRAAKLATRSSEAELLLALMQPPEPMHGKLFLKHLPRLKPPEWVFAAEEFLQSDSLPEELRAQGAQAVRARLSELTVASPHAMQYPALLLVTSTSPEAPFSSEELQALEVMAALPDWRETDFRVLFQHALDELQKAHHSQPEHAAFMFAVSALASRTSYMLFKRTEASREALSAQQLHRLGAALWGIGSRMSEESTLLEHLLGTRLMAEGATLIGDEARAQRVAEMREKAQRAAEAMRQAAPDRWPLRALNAEHLEAHVQNELGCMLRFLPPMPEQ